MLYLQASSTCALTKGSIEREAVMVFIVIYIYYAFVASYIVLNTFTNK